MALKTDSHECFPGPDPCIFNGMLPSQHFFLNTWIIFSYFSCTIFTLKVSQCSSTFHRMLLLLGNFMYGKNKSIKIRLTSRCTLPTCVCIFCVCSDLQLGLKRHNLYLPVETTYFSLIGIRVYNFCCKLWRLGGWRYFTSHSLWHKPSQFSLWISVDPLLVCISVAAKSSREAALHWKGLKGLAQMWNICCLAVLSS